MVTGISPKLRLFSANPRAPNSPTCTPMAPYMTLMSAMYVIEENVASTPPVMRLSPAGFQ